MSLSLEYLLSGLNFIPQHPAKAKPRARQKQAVSPQYNSLLETVISKILVVFPFRRESSATVILELPCMSLISALSYQKIENEQY